MIVIDKKKLRRGIEYTLVTLLALFLLLYFSGLWDKFWNPSTVIDQTVTAYVYTTDGEKTGETEVKMLGERKDYHNGDQTYFGRFAIDHVPATCRENTNVSIERKLDQDGNAKVQTILVFEPGNINSDIFVQGCYVSPGMYHFAVMTAQGEIIATHDYLAQLMALYPAVYSLDNLNFSYY